MCGRFTLALPADALAKLLQLNRDLDRELAAEAAAQPRYNIAPGQEVLAAVRGDSDVDRQLVRFRWGLVPAWAKDPAVGNRMINARAESLAEKPAFREAYAAHRCLIPADGFYEWKKTAGLAQPWYFRLKETPGFTMAGLWERFCKPAGGTLDSCTIITTAANRLVGRIHPRMPVILDPRGATAWLDAGVPQDTLQTLLQAFDPEKMTADPVDPRVNDTKVDDPGCRLPVPDRGGRQAELF